MSNKKSKVPAEPTVVDTHDETLAAASDSAAEEYSDKELMAAIEDQAGGAAMFKDEGDSVAGIFKGLKFAETKDSREFYLMTFEQTDGSLIDAFCSRKLYEFFFDTSFPVGEYLKITYVGTQEIKGKNPMRLYRYEYPQRLQLQRKPSNLFSVDEARNLFNPIAPSRIQKLTDGDGETVE